MRTAYRYFTDPVFLGAIALFALNELLFKRLASPPVFRNHFNAFLLIPCALPVVLWLQASLGLRPVESYPTAAEITGHLLVWSLLFELAGPVIVNHATGDWRDLICYGLGAALAGWAWRADSRNRWRKAA